jgi:hypothetical protein
MNELRPILRQLEQLQNEVRSLRQRLASFPVRWTAGGSGGGSAPPLLKFKIAGERHCGEQYKIYLATPTAGIGVDTTHDRFGDVAGGDAADTYAAGAEECTARNLFLEGSGGHSLTINSNHAHITYWGWDSDLKDEEGRRIIDFHGVAFAAGCIGVGP